MTYFVTLDVVFKNIERFKRNIKRRDKVIGLHKICRAIKRK